MNFEDTWQDAVKSNRQPIDDVLKPFAKVFFMAGLLHAAEQDEEESKIDGIHITLSQILIDQALLHRKTAEKLL